MKRTPTIVLAILFLAFSYTSNAQRYFCLLSPDFNEQVFVILDFQALTILDSVPLTYDNGDIDGFNGLAHNPTNGLLYAVLKNENTNARELATIDTLGNVNYIGDLGCRISSITFGPDGTLYGITGSGNEPYETMFTININNADTTRFLVPPSSGWGDGEALAYNYANNLIYRYHGDELMQTINPMTLEVDTLFNDFDDYWNWSQDLFYDAAANHFKFFDGENVYIMTPAGALTLHGALPSGVYFKGVVDAAVVGTIGMEEETVRPRITIFPNPTEGIFTVKHSLNNATILVTDISGRTVLETIENIVDLSGHPAGIYLVTVFNDQQSSTLKLLKK